MTAASSLAASSPAMTSSSSLDAGPDGSGLQPCTNPTQTLPLDPNNPQSGVTIGNYFVDTNAYNAAGYTVSQTIYICDAGSWYVVANMNNDTGDGAVKIYPDVDEDFAGPPALSSFNTISSNFTHTAPHVGIYAFAYDMWLDGVATSTSIEVMVWTDNYNEVPEGTKMETVTIDGQTYDVYQNGNGPGSTIAFVDTANVTSGTLDLISFFNHAIGKGWAPSDATVSSIAYGVAIVSTGGADATFAVDSFSITTN